MTIAIGENRETGRRVIMIALEAVDVRNLPGGILINKEEAPNVGFPDDVELAILAMTPDDFIAYCKEHGAIGRETKFVHVKT